MVPDIAGTSPGTGAEAGKPRLRLSRPTPARRIVVFGVTGSGKTSVARRLGVALSLPVIELDALMWTQPDWVMTPEEVFIPRVSAALAEQGDGWVVEGNYASVRESLLRQADTVVWLRFPWRTSFWRVLKRTLRRARTRELLWGTNRESLRQHFLSRDSLLWWAIHHHRAGIRSIGRSLAEIPHEADVLVVRSSRDLEEVVATLAEAAVERANAQA